jgi:ABC-type methionine transport system ATPase subunit
VSLAIELSDVRLARGERVVLSGVSLQVEAGHVLSLLGESGGGKSTLLKLIDRLVEPDAGQVTVLGRPAGEWPVGELRREAVYVGQRPSLLAHGTAREELSLPLTWAGRALDEGALRAALDCVGLEVDLERPAHELSGGELVRLALARALLLEPKLLLLDEPSGSLDVRLAARVLEGVRAWAGERGVTLVVVTHRPADLRQLGGQGAVLLGGHLHGPLPVEELLDSGGGPEVQAFLAEWRAGRDGSP